MDQDPRQALLARLAVEFELVDPKDCAAACAADGDVGDQLVANGHLTPDQLALLRPLGELLRLRERDRLFAEAAVASGRVTTDEIEYAFSAQESAFRRSGALRSVSELLIEIGAIDEAFRDELRREIGSPG